MPFSTLFFVCGFLPLCMLVHAIATKRWRNAVVLGFSLIFYAWGAPRFLPVILALGVADFFVARGVAASNENASLARRKRLLAAGICVHVSVLFYFKYANFAVGELNALRIGHGMPALDWTLVILPIGISFLTFEEISYLVDCYRGDGEPTRKLQHYLLFLMLFPHSIAGPIFRWRDLQKQLGTRDVTLERTLEGFTRFSLGLAKKILVADSVAVLVDNVFNRSDAMVSCGGAWLAAVAYTVQIYFDFSGYSDMAIGLGRMLGFDFRENFREPYRSLSITEFWTRWHISLSSWLRNYLYIPLGGNRVGRVRAELNTFIVFLVCGIWHGAAWTFVLWGIYNGVLVVLERRLKPLLDRVPPLLRGVLTLFLVLLGWVLFRAKTLAQAQYYFALMFGQAKPSMEPLELPAEVFPRICLVVLAGALAWIFVRLAQAARAAKTETETAGTTASARVWSPSTALSLVLLALSMMHMANTKYLPLIYFKF